MNRKLQKITAVLAMLILTGIAQAEEITNYHLQVAASEVSKYTSKFKLNPSEAPHGVYITAVGGWSAVYPHVADLLKDKFRANGFIVTDNIAEADIGINVFGIGLPLEDVEDKVSHVNKDYVASNIGAAILTGGVSLVSTGIALFGKEKGIANIDMHIYKGPLKLTGRGRVDSEKGMVNQALIGSSYVADAVNATVYTDLFELVTNAMMKEYTVKADSGAMIAPIAPVAVVSPVQK